MVDGSEKESLWTKIIDQFQQEIDTKKEKENVLKFTINLLATLPHFNWTGIYLLKHDTLELFDHYVGKPTDHIKINIGQGVCGTAVAEKKDIIVEDVQKLDNYLACSVETRAEIVVLIKDHTGEILGQIDVDSDSLGAFDDIDRKNLRIIAQHLGKVI